MSETQTETGPDGVHEGIARKHGDDEFDIIRRETSNAPKWIVSLREQERDTGQHNES